MEQVVKLNDLGNGIVIIQMEDRLSKNGFSHQLLTGLMNAYAAINANPCYKVAVLTGYENYFSSGGTQEELISLYKGEIRFNEMDFFTHPLKLNIPVISAMQGHGIGGGFVLGLYADFPILGEENIYTANFMKYGFTPGMGATMMVPLKIGAVLGQEMLFTAQSYRGIELKQRGAALKIVPRVQVLEEAIAMAGNLAEKPAVSLAALKRHMATPVLANLQEVISQELAMHKVTFHQPEVQDRINGLFGQ